MRSIGHKAPAPAILALAVLALAVAATPAAVSAPAAERVAGLPPDPADWVCADPEPPVDPQVWCKTERTRREGAALGVEPALLDDVEGKNDWDGALKDFLVGYEYRETALDGGKGLDWYGDLGWRLTGPIVGPLPQGGEFAGKTYGAHPAVRIYYSPEVMDWLCDDRQGEVAAGGMIIKEMRNLDATPIEAPDGCMQITEQLDPQSWTVMVKGDGVTHDGWYWANPTNSMPPDPPDCPSREAFPLLLDASATTDPGFWDEKCRPGVPPSRRLDAWYPTGLGSERWSQVYPWSLFGGYCLNCHASAASELTYSSLDNILTPGLQYKNFPLDSTPWTRLETARTAIARHTPVDAAESAAPAGPYPPPLPAPTPAFTAFFGDDLEPASYADAWELRMPSETRDHHPAAPGAESEFLTSDQCIGCHDATISNDETPNMVVEVDGVDYNVSPYAEWRVSPMGLAGRDPIFFSQLESEVLNLPELGPCIENTCLHCHGVMGQRQFAADHPGGAGAPCKSDIFVLDPPAGVPFGDEPYRRAWVGEWQSDEPHNEYAALSRDGISCTVCHRIAEQSLADGENGYTGNFVTPDGGELFGPYADDTVVTAPMEHAIGRTPVAGSQISDSGICNSCHNILLPLFDNDGQPHYYEAPDGTEVRAKYEQTTGLEWQNSVFARGETFQSCQECHMPESIGDHPLGGTRIANIEDSGFAPTTHRLPDADITLTPRDTFARHSLHGLNIFLNQMFQQFPIMLGFRQIDYMNGSTQPALVAGAESMLDMAAEDTADVSITGMKPVGDRLEVTVLVANEVGHFLPSGVGFRRVLLELVATDDAGEVVFASGVTNSLGVIVDYSAGTCTDPGNVDSCRPIAGENFYASETAYQPHYQTVEATSQAQIYQELIRDSAGDFTTSFLRRIDDVKDNRLRGRGYDPAVFAASASPYIQELAHPIGGTAGDPYYTDPKLTGADEVVYSIPLDAGKPVEVRVALYSQSIPPFYLQQRFRDAELAQSAADKADIQRLYYLTSRLNTQRMDAPEAPRPIEDWKLRLAADCSRIDGAACRRAGVGSAP